MRNKVKDMIDSWVTSLIGVGTMVMTLILVYKGTFDWVWEGIGGLVTGSILLMAPKTIEKKLSEFIKAWGSKSSDFTYDPSARQTPDNPDEN